MEISWKLNWTKEEESTLINEIESVGEILRRSGNSAGINKKKRQLWKDIAARINSVHGSNRAVDDIKKRSKITAVPTSFNCGGTIFSCRVIVPP